MLVQGYRVERVRKELENTVTLDLRAPSGAPMAFAPGQFNMLYLFGSGEIPISISGDPAQPETLTHTIRSVGVVSDGLCKVRRGDTVGVRGPFGTHWPVEAGEGQDILIVAGGIGLAPLRPAIYYLLANRERYGAISLLYGARTQADLLFPHELERWRGRFDLDVQVTVDSADAGWRGHVGVVPKLIPQAEFNPANTMALVCGPEIMMRFTILELQKQGVADDQIFISMERNMKCAIGHCGHCQLGPFFICKDGPVFSYAAIKDWFVKRDV